MFLPVQRYFKKIAIRNHTSEWKPKELPDKSIKYPAASDNSITPAINHINKKLPVKFEVV